MSVRSIVTASAFALVLGSPIVSAQDMSGHNMSMDMGHPKGDQGPSSQAFAKANAEMHKNMAIEYSGDTDTDFVRSMIPHHQGAINMAKVELQYGKNPELRKLAENIIQAQEAEIRMMQDWLKTHGK
ncbi:MULTISPECIES: DUF305 domain-containing protein [unclassified Sinorhizobium]|uniref:CopM family metallochaperone n=1 Tax=unclassified Sinorhizobium TaxID=2613772 RepID=UPI003526A5ED